ncbi:MAG: hypothetical protein MHM6MM_008794 [Cercozoa sp. M6MM]
MSDQDRIHLFPQTGQEPVALNSDVHNFVVVLVIMAALFWACRLTVRGIRLRELSLALSTHSLVRLDVVGNTSELWGASRSRIRQAVRQKLGRYRVRAMAEVRPPLFVRKQVRLERPNDSTANAIRLCLSLAWNDAPLRSEEVHIYACDHDNDFTDDTDNNNNNSNNNNNNNDRRRSRSVQVQRTSMDDWCARIGDVVSARLQIQYLNEEIKKEVAVQCEELCLDLPVDEDLSQVDDLWHVIGELRIELRLRLHDGSSVQQLLTLRDGAIMQHVWTLPDCVLMLHALYGMSRSESDDMGDACVVCLSAARDTCLLPCRHCCLCLRCAQPLDKCPVCRTAVTSFLRTAPNQRIGAVVSLRDSAALEALLRAEKRHTESAAVRVRIESPRSASVIS